MSKKYHKKKTIPFNFGDKHIQYIRKCTENVYNIAEGAVRAGKTIDNVYAFAHELESHPDKLHLATGSTAANAKLNIGDANGFGLEWIFRGQCRWGKYKGNDCLIICGPKTNYQQKIVLFAGAALGNSFKKIRGNSYGMWIATEINLHHDNTIKEAFNRLLASKRRKIFWDLNPDHPKAKIYIEYIDKYIENNKTGKLLGGVNYEHFTIFDNINISEESRNEFISQYEEGSIWYLRDIKGMRRVAEGLIYQCFNKDIHTLDTSNLKFSEYYISIDYGTVNPFSAGLWGKSGDIWYRIKEYYHDSRKAGHQLTDEDYYNNILELADDRKIKSIVIDPSAASLITLIRKNGKFKVRKGNNEVIAGIRNTSTELKNKRILFDKTCKDTIDEFGAYIWDVKSVDKDKPIKENDHAMDDIRYFVNTIIYKKKSGITILT